MNGKVRVKEKVEKVKARDIYVKVCLVQLFGFNHSLTFASIYLVRKLKIYSEKFWFYPDVNNIFFFRYFNNLAHTVVVLT